MTAIERVIEIATAEVGYLEKASNAQLDDKTANAGSANYTKYARDLDALGFYNGKKNGYAWCAVFVDWCLVQAFGMETALKMTYQAQGGLGASSTYSARYYKDNGQFYDSPQPGDQIFFTNDGGNTFNHTGLVTKVEGGKVYTIEGNTSSASGVVANGGAVRDKSYSLTYAKIGGYGRPNYSIVQEDDDDMDVTRFKELWYEMRAELQDNDAGDWSQEAREWAVSNGIIQGSSDDEFNGMWQDVLTREQMAVLLYRFAQLMGKA